MIGTGYGEPYPEVADRMDSSALMEWLLVAGAAGETLLWALSALAGAATMASLGLGAWSVRADRPALRALGDHHELRLELVTLFLLSVLVFVLWPIGAFVWIAITAELRLAAHVRARDEADLPPVPMDAPVVLHRLALALICMALVSAFWLVRWGLSQAGVDVVGTWWSSPFLAVGLGALWVRIGVDQGRTSPLPLVSLMLWAAVSAEPFPRKPEPRRRRQRKPRPVAERVVTAAQAAAAPVVEDSVAADARAAEAREAAQKLAAGAIARELAVADREARRAAVRARKEAAARARAQERLTLVELAADAAEALEGLERALLEPEPAPVVAAPSEAVSQEPVSAVASPVSLTGEELAEGEPATQVTPETTAAARALVKPASMGAAAEDEDEADERTAVSKRSPWDKTWPRAATSSDQEADGDVDSEEDEATEATA